MRYDVLCSVERLRFIQKRRERLLMRKIERVYRVASARTCWPDLVMWLWDERERTPWRRRRPYPLRHHIRAGLPQECVTDAGRCGWCWCGKLVTQQTADAWRAENYNTADLILVEAADDCR